MFVYSNLSHSRGIPQLTSSTGQPLRLTATHSGKKRPICGHTSVVQTLLLCGTVHAKPDGNVTENLSVVLSVG